MRWDDETRGRKPTKQKQYLRRYKYFRVLAQEVHREQGWWPCNGMIVHKEDFCEERKHIAILKWRFREKGCV